MVYLDHNATTTVRPEVIDLMIQIMGETGNASAVHKAGKLASAHVETAREQVARAVNTRPAQVIFTSCATESMNTILKTFKGERILVSAIEHAAIIDCGLDTIELIPVDHNGVINLVVLEEMLSREPKAALANIMMVNNETGVIQPVKEAAALCKKYGTYLHVDAVQALGKMHIDFKEMDADYMSFSAHKIGGPQGVGCFIFGAGRPIRPLLSGGKQEKRQRAGTVNVAGIAGMGLAADLAVQNISVYKELSQWRDKIECELSNAINGMIINGQNAHRVGNTLSITCPGVANMVQLINLDLDSICVSAGSACSSGVAKPSHVLTAMGLSDNDALSTIRVSMGWNTSESDVNYFIEAYQKIIKRLSR